MPVNADDLAIRVGVRVRHEPRWAWFAAGALAVLAVQVVAVSAYFAGSGAASVCIDRGVRR